MSGVYVEVHPSHHRRAPGRNLCLPYAMGCRFAVSPWRTQL